MHIMRWLPFSAVCLLTGGCQSPHPPEQRLAHMPTDKPLQQLVGTWVAWPVGQQGGSYLVCLNADSTGTFLMYGDRGQAFVRQYGGPRYYLSQGPVQVSYHPHQIGKVRYVPNLEVQLFMRDARFDYELNGDTLREYDKEGYQGMLVRLHNTD